MSFVLVENYPKKAFWTQSDTDFVMLNVKKDLIPQQEVLPSIVKNLHEKLEYKTRMLADRDVQCSWVSATLAFIWQQFQGASYRTLFPSPEDSLKVLLTGAGHRDAPLIKCVHFAASHGLDYIAAAHTKIAACKGNVQNMKRTVALAFIAHPNVTFAMELCVDSALEAKATKIAVQQLREDHEKVKAEVISLKRKRQEPAIDIVMSQNESPNRQGAKERHCQELARIAEYQRSVRLQMQQHHQQDQQIRQMCQFQQTGQVLMPIAEEEAMEICSE